MLTPEQLGAAAAELAAVERSLTDTATRFSARSACLRRVAGDSTTWWAGPRADAYRSTAADLIGPLTPLPAAIGDAQRVVAATRHAADELGRRLATIDRAVVDHHALIRWYRADVDHTWSTPGAEARARSQLRRLQQERASIEIEWASRSRSATITIERTASSLPRLGVPTGSAAVPLGPLLGPLLGHLHGQLGGPATPAMGADAVARWWGELDPGARAALLAVLPAVIGNLDGVPVAVRVDANRRSLQRALDAAPVGSDEWHRLQQFTDPDHPGRVDPDRQFLVFDPAGDGLVAEVFGDLATADHVAVLVPGMGSTLDGFHDLAGRAERLHRTAGATTAIVAWTGYDTPAGAALTPHAFEVVSDRQAEVGGDQLHSFVDGLRLETGAALTLIGHSYGTLTVGKALVDGAQVERVVFMGSPGVGVDRVGDFPPGAADEFFASEIKGDVVATLEHFGSDPTDPDFGARVFDSGDGDGLTPISRHAEYYDDGIAIENLATILTGGTPTAGRTDVVEYLTEPMEDLREFHGAVVDRIQEFDIPLVDDTVVDGAIEVGRRAGDITGQVGQVVIEEIGHFGQDAVEWSADRVADVVSGGADLVTGWFW